MPQATQILSVTIEEQAFDGCPKRAVVSESIGKQQQQRTLGVIESAQIFDWIDRGEPLQLSNKLIIGFSLTAYRSSRNLGDDQLVTLCDFQAERAVFHGGFNVKHARFTGSQCIFRAAHFSAGECSFYHSEFAAHRTDFREACFNSSGLNLQYAGFDGKEVDFDEAVFACGEVMAVSSNFGNARVSFRNANFTTCDVDFHYSSFGSGHVTFDKAQFAGSFISFKRVDFGDGKVDFKRVSFGHGDIDFSETNFRTGKVVFRSSLFGNGRISFDETVSESDFIFDNSTFGTGSLSFVAATAYKLGFQNCVFNGYLDLRVTKSHRIDLSYAIVRDVLDLMPTDKLLVQVDILQLSGVRNLGSIYIDWRLNKVRRMILSQVEASAKDKFEQFLLLKQCFGATGRYSDEDKAYVWYKRFEAQAELNHVLARNKLNALWAYPSHFFKWLLFDKVGLYATDPLRVLLSVAIIYSAFSLLFVVLPLVADTHIETTAGEALVNLGPVAKSFYFSAITFLTIGYGDYFPVGIMRFFAAVEGYTGVFLMGYFSVAFVRKVLR